MKCTTAVAALGLVLVGLTPADAHHSFDAEYDSKKVVTIMGVVTKLDWINPHAFVYIDTKDDSGTVRRYKVEMGPPYALMRGGWTLESVKIGDTVTVKDAALAKDGSDAAGSMQSTSMSLASGQQLVMR
jgi:hypothetical protein